MTVLWDSNLSTAVRFKELFERLKAYRLKAINDVTARQQKQKDNFECRRGSDGRSLSSSYLSKSTDTGVKKKVPDENSTQI